MIIMMKIPNKLTLTYSEHRANCFDFLCFDTFLYNDYYYLKVLHEF